jgi:hypothetical protein
MAYRRQVGSFGIPEEVAWDLAVWLVILLGVVFGLGGLAMVEALALVSGS